jgi:hypothetical protein
MRPHSHFVILATVFAITACSSSSSQKSCDPVGQTGCASGLVCETVPGSAPTCFDPLYVDGRIYDLADANPSTNGLGDARVVGQDVNGAPVSAAVVSGSDGSYEFAVHAPRSPNGSPASGTVTLRVDRAGYATFPSGLRTALPIALTTATHATGRWTVQSPLSNVGLNAVANAPAGKITGTVTLPPAGAVLVVAECGALAFTAVPGNDGKYSIFNVSDGPCTVTAYAKGVNYAPASVNVAAAGPNPVTANLVPSTAPTATVSGTVQFVSSTHWSSTSVLLVVASTYDAARVRGISVPGLEASGVSAGNWAISGIPDGHYRVLAAFETDYLVRDPSDIGGTAVLEFQVVNGLPLLMDGTTSAATLQGFKITGAVRLTAPFADATGACTTLASLPADPAALPVGGCATTSATPTVAWEAYPSTTYYEVIVVDETGATVWDATASSSPVDYGAAAGTGNVTATLTAAQPLIPGATYQFRVRADQTKGGGGGFSTISTSEDLLGIFTFVP